MRHPPSRSCRSRAGGLGGIPRSCLYAHGLGHPGARRAPASPLGGIGKALAVEAYLSIFAAASSWISLPAAGIEAAAALCTTLLPYPPCRLPEHTRRCVQAAAAVVASVVSAQGRVSRDEEEQRRSAKARTQREAKALSAELNGAVLQPQAVAGGGPA